MLAKLLRYISMKVLKKLIFGIAALCLTASPSLAQNPAFTKVAANDCGVPGAQPFLVKGENYTMPSRFSGSRAALTCNFGGKDRKSVV